MQVDQKRDRCSTEEHDVRTKVSYFKMCLGGSEQRDDKVLVGSSVGNINGRVVMDDLNYQFRKFGPYSQGN